MSSSSSGVRASELPSERSALLESVLRPAVARYRATRDAPDDTHAKATRALAECKAVLQGVAGFDAAEVDDALRLWDDQLEPEKLARLTSFVNNEFENPRARTCWLSCTFQVLWHSENWHRGFCAALAAGDLDDVEEQEDEDDVSSDSSESNEHKPTKRRRANNEHDNRLRAFARTWRTYSATGHTEQDPDEDDWTDFFSLPQWLDWNTQLSDKKMISPAALARAFEDAADRRGYGDCADAIALVVQAADAHVAPAVAALSNLLRVVPVVYTGRAPDLNATYESNADAFGLRDAAVVAFDMGWEVALSAESIALTTRKLGSTTPASYRHVALVAFSRSLKHYVCFCASRRKSGEFIFFNDLPGTLLYGGGISNRTRSKQQNNAHPKAVSAASRNRLKSWADIAERCASLGLQPRCVVVEKDLPP